MNKRVMALGLVIGVSFSPMPLQAGLIDRFMSASKIETLCNLAKQHPVYSLVTVESLVDSSWLAYKYKTLEYKSGFEKKSPNPDQLYIVEDCVAVYKRDQYSLFLSVSDDSITELYRRTGEYWLCEMFQKKINAWHVSEMLPLLQDAKSILRSFLPNDTILSLMKYNFNGTISLIGHTFIKKSDVCSRLFTYAKLARVIKDKQLSHIHLPLKLLAIKNKNTGKYVIDNKIAGEFLDNMIKAFMLLDGNKSHCLDTDLELFVFAEKKERSDALLSQEAFDNLNVLIAEAPFDVGSDNIFSDSRGDAVIIDTEFKGESAENSSLKLMRYVPYEEEEYE